LHGLLHDRGIRGHRGAPAEDVDEEGLPVDERRQAEQPIRHESRVRPHGEKERGEHLRIRGAERMIRHDDERTMRRNAREILRRDHRMDAGDAIEHLEAERPVRIVAFTRRVGGRAVGTEAIRDGTLDFVRERVDPIDEQEPREQRTRGAEERAAPAGWRRQHVERVPRTAPGMIDLGHVLGALAVLAVEQFAPARRPSTRG